MKLFTLFAATSLFFNLAFANDFLGQNTFYSEETSNTFAMEASLNNDGTGSIVTFIGNSDVNWTEDENGKLSLKLVTPVTFKRTMAFTDSTTGQVDIIEVKDTLTEATLAKTTVVTIETLWTITSDDPRFEETTRTDTAENLSMTAEFSDHEFAVEEGLRLALPSFGTEQTSGAVHVELQENQKAVTLRSFDGFPFEEMVWTLSSDKKELIMSVPNVASTRYRIIQTGLVNKVVAYTTLGTSQKIMGQFMAYDAQVPKELITEDAVKGSYRATTTTPEEALFYHFAEDNLGGFDSTMPDGTKFEDFWSWRVEEGVIIAERFIKLGTNGNPGGAPESREEVAQCVDGTLQCQLRSSREYRILAAEGDTYSLLRTLSHKGDTRKSRSSVWVFEKQ